MAFVGRLRQVVAAHDTETLAAMMTTDFGYVLDPPREGPGVFRLLGRKQPVAGVTDAVVKERFVPFGDRTSTFTWFRRPNLPANPTTYTGYRAGIHLINGSWKFAYFVNGQ